MNIFEPAHPAAIPLALAIIVGLIFGLSRPAAWCYDRSLDWFVRTVRRQ